MEANLIKPSIENIKVAGDLGESMAAKHLVDELHLLYVVEQIPVVDTQLASNVS